MATATLYVEHTEHLLNWGEKPLFAKVKGQFYKLGISSSDRVYTDHNWRGKFYDMWLSKELEEECRKKIRDILRNPHRWNIAEKAGNLIFVKQRIHIQTCDHCGHVV